MRLAGTVRCADAAIPYPPLRQSWPRVRATFRAAPPPAARIAGMKNAGVIAALFGVPGRRRKRWQVSVPQALAANPKRCSGYGMPHGTCASMGTRSRRSWSTTATSCCSCCTWSIACTHGSIIQDRKALRSISTVAPHLVGDPCLLLCQRVDLCSVRSRYVPLLHGQPEASKQCAARAKSKQKGHRACTAAGSKGNTSIATPCDKSERK